MKYFSFLGCMLLGFPCLIAQFVPTIQADPIVNEGKHLYRLELASWVGSDLFFAKYPSPEDVAGYFSYVEGDLTKCVFYSQAAPAIVIGTVAFEERFAIETGELDLSERAFSKDEQLRYEMREKVLTSLETDTLVRMYDNTSLNIIPTVWGGERKVYLLTGPLVSGVVIFGNDYLYRFNKDNEIVARKALHQNMLPIEYEEEEDKGKALVSMHAHSDRTGDFITATDICTLLLYAEYTGWETHQVISGKYVNIWHCRQETLAVFPRTTLERIQKHVAKKEQKQQEKRKRKSKN